jgi:hypothetical protein
MQLPDVDFFDRRQIARNSVISVSQYLTPSNTILTSVKEERDRRTYPSHQRVALEPRIPETKMNNHDYVDQTCRNLMAGVALAGVFGQPLPVSLSLPRTLES